MSKETRIKLPVRYDPKGFAVRNDEWGSIIAKISYGFDACVDHGARERVHKVGRAVADALNNSADLEAKLAEVEKERDAYAAMFKDVDIIQFGKGAITVCGGQQECWDVLNNQGVSQGHFPSVLEAYAALSASGEE